MMGIDYAIAGLNNPALTFVAALIDNDVLFAALVVAIVLATELRNEKRKKIFAALALALVLSFAIKEMYQVKRPCIPELLKVACPDSYSFPSMHAALAFTLMLSFINKKSYPAYLAFALFIGFTRIYLGVHTLEDVAASTVVAAIAYYGVDRVIGNDTR
jgi:undecaprenyl-diphosphatase